MAFTATLWKFLKGITFCLLQPIRHIFLSLLNAMKCTMRYLMAKIHDFALDAGRETGILALTLMANRNLHTFERGLWFVIVLGSIFGAIKLSNSQIKRYQNSPTVVSVDRDFRGWNGSLPAVTLCYYDHIDSFKANEYIQNNWNVSIIDEDYFYFMDFLYAVVNASARNYADLARFAEDERLDDVNLLELIRAVDRPFEQVITSFDANFEVQIQPVMTERGSCYAINSPFSATLTGSPIGYEEIKAPLICQYGKQQCYIKMDLYESTGTIDIHSPYEVSVTNANVLSLRKSDEITASYKVLETVPSSNLRDLTISQRKCVYNDEETSNLKVYSKSLCLARCRAVMALEMCNCVPFFYPFVEGTSCSPAGFECLSDFKWPVWALHICKCPSTCMEIEYSVQMVKKSSWGAKANEEVADMVTSSFRWDLIPPKVRMRRDVVFSFEDLLVSFGGAVALFLGFSLLSITQLSYVLLHHILMNLSALVMICCKFCGKLFRVSRKPQQSKPYSPQTNLTEVKPANKATTKFKLKRRFLTAIHRNPSEECITTTAEIDFFDRGLSCSDNSDIRSITPEYKYLK